MKKDFSQTFEAAENLYVYLLAEVASNGDFLVLRHFDNDEEHHSLPAVEIPSKAELVGQLVKALYPYGLVLRSFRELDRTTIAHFSFIDNTSGTKEDCVLIHASVDRVTQPPTDKEGEQRLFVRLYQLPDLLSMAYSPTHIVPAALARIHAERELL